MSSFWLSFYILVWPMISAGILALLLVSLVRDWRKAKQTGKTMV